MLSVADFPRAWHKASSFLGRPDGWVGSAWLDEGAIARLDTMKDARYGDGGEDHARDRVLTVADAESGLLLHFYR